MVITNNDFEGQRKPRGYKVAPCNRKQLRTVASDCVELLKKEGCFKEGRAFLDTSFLLENLLFRANYQLHIVDESELTETAAFTIPEKGLLILRSDVYDGLIENDAFARYTVVHEFSHIVLDHAITLHRGEQLGNHEWWEDSEWQANNLAAEILMPVEVIKELGAKPILIQAECGVSSRAATNRIANLRTERLL